MRAWRQVVTGTAATANSDNNSGLVSISQTKVVSQTKEGRGERLMRQDSGCSEGDTSPQMQKRVQVAATSGATAAVRGGNSSGSGHRDPDQRNRKSGGCDGRRLGSGTPQWRSGALDCSHNPVVSLENLNFPVQSFCQRGCFLAISNHIKKCTLKSNPNSSSTEQTICHPEISC